MNERTARLTLGLGVPALALTTGLVPLALSWSRLPDRVATNFDWSGTPSDSMPLAGLVVTTGILMVTGLVATVALALIRRPHPPGVTAAATGFVGGLLAQTGASICALTAFTQRDVADWHDARQSSLAVLALVAVGLAIGSVAAVAATALPTSPEGSRDGRSVPALDLAPGEHAVWARTVHVRWLAGIGLACLGLAVTGVVLGLTVAGGGLGWPLSLGGLAAGLAMLTMSTIRVRADATGLGINYGLLPWPRTTIRVADMERVAVIDLSPSEWGGWGYRGSLALMHRAAVVLRAGPALRLDLTRGRVFAVTVDQPEEAAALLNAERDRIGATSA